MKIITLNAFKLTILKKLTKTRIKINKKGSKTTK